MVIILIILIDCIDLQEVSLYRQYIIIKYKGIYIKSKIYNNTSQNNITTNCQPQYYH